MINAIITAISIALNEEFGDAYECDMEENKQDLQEPCFFISCPDPNKRQFLGERYERRNMFCIQFFPESENINEECHDTAERMFECLEYITAGGNLIRGTDMGYEIIDGILNFFVNYNFFTYRMKEEGKMETMESGINVKG